MSILYEYINELCFTNAQNFETILLRNQCGFRKEFSAQLCLLAMLKNGNWPLMIRKDLVHFSLIFLKAMGYYQHLRLIQIYLSKRKERTKINSGFSLWEEIFPGYLKDQF